MYVKWVTRAYISWFYFVKIVKICWYDPFKQPQLNLKVFTFEIDSKPSREFIFPRKPTIHEPPYFIHAKTYPCKKISKAFLSIPCLDQLTEFIFLIPALAELKAAALRKDIATVMLVAGFYEELCQHDILNRMFAILRKVTQSVLLLYPRVTTLQI